LRCGLLKKDTFWPINATTLWAAWDIAFPLTILWKGNHFQEQINVFMLMCWVFMFIKERAAGTMSTSMWAELHTYRCSTFKPQKR
jgi:hypothetical protein